MCRYLDKKTNKKSGGLTVEQIKIGQEVRIKAPVFKGLIYKISDCNISDDGLRIMVSRTDPVDGKMVYSQEMRPWELEVVKRSIKEIKKQTNNER